MNIFYAFTRICEWILQESQATMPMPEAYPDLTLSIFHAKAFVCLQAYDPCVGVQKINVGDVLIVHRVQGESFFRVFSVNGKMTLKEGWIITEKEIRENFRQAH